MARILILALAAWLLAACEKPLLGDAAADNVVLSFIPTATTRADLGGYFTKLNVQVFADDGSKVFSTVRTQTASDAHFGTLSVRLAEGTYTVVSVGHSSTISATIKSTTACQFTASDGEKLTDTFCCCQQITIGDASAEFALPMYRATAMVQFCLTDSVVPDNFSHFLIEYTGGSANFNPSSLEGITKSTQSERRTTNGIQTYQVFTFPYLAATGTLKMTCTALDVDGNTIRQRTFDAVPVTRNRITTYNGTFFLDGDGQFTQSDFGFVVHADWDGEDFYTF